jgi:6-phosphogluconate dehydrogenase
LVKIAAEICETKDKHGRHILADVQDKVVQDIDGSEGTGIWSNTQAVDLHVPSPTLTAAHYLRIASAYRGKREHVEKSFHGSFLPSRLTFKDDAEQDAFLEDLRWAVYCTCLAAYVQGISIIDGADNENKWDINYGNIVQIWKAGCIIQADHINDLLGAIFHPESTSPHKNHNLLYEPTIVSELKTGFESLKRIVVKGTEANAVMPSLSATLEYLKYSGNLELPTQFYEAELDYFGKHMYDSKHLDKGPGLPMTGKRHYEWKKA